MKTTSNMQSAPPLRQGIQYGILLGIIYILFELIRFFTGTHYRTTRPHLVFRIIMLTVAVVLAIHQYTKKDTIPLRVKAIITIGAVLGITTSLVLIAYNFTLTSFIEPDYYETYSEVFRPHHAANHPNLTPQQVDADVKAGLLSLREVSIVAFVSTTVGAVILALCSYVVMKRFKSEV